jgi:AraC family transcriptional regulator
LPPEDVNAVLSRESLPSAATDPVLWLLIDTLRQLCHERDEPSPKLLEPILTALGRRVFLRHGKNAPTPNGNGLSPSRLQRVREHIQGHLASHLDVRTLAQLVALSPAHFTEVFRASTGYSPMEYVREQRHLKAHALALAGEHRYSEIADLCGFADVSHLNREF